MRPSTPFSISTIAPYGTREAVSGDRKLRSLAALFALVRSPHALTAWSRRHRKIEVRTKAEKDLRRIPKHDGARITEAILALRAGLTGDVKRLTNFTPEYRLRVGDWRVLFEVEGDKIVIYRILHRREAYRLP